jgi:DNA polymerase I-like protein with 3'-5' exonuclease and polymerase domains
LHTYDEIVLCVPDERVERAKRAMEFEMTLPPEWMPDLPLAVEIGVGKRYGEAK